MERYIKIVITNDSQRADEQITLSKTPEGHVQIELAMGLPEDGAELLQQHTIEIALNRFFQELSLELAQHFSMQWSREVNREWVEVGETT